MIRCDGSNFKQHGIISSDDVATTGRQLGRLTTLRSGKTLEVESEVKKKLFLGPHNQWDHNPEFGFLCGTDDTAKNAFWEGLLV